MNRRNFLTSSTLCAGALSLVPTSVFSHTSAISIYSIGNGFNKLSKHVQHVLIDELSYDLKESYKKMTQVLDDKGYNYDGSEVVKFSPNCFAIPLNKKPLLGFSSKELALLIKHNGDYNYYILDEQTSEVFSSLIENYSLNSSHQKLNLDVLAFITPIHVVKESSGKTNIFAYKNKFENTIILRTCNKKQVVLVN